MGHSLLKRFVILSTAFGATFFMGQYQPYYAGGDLVVITNGDTYFPKGGVSLTSTAGTSTVTWGANVSGSFAGATIVITGCGQLVASNPITVTGGGSGYVVGDTVTMTPGAGGSDDGTNHLVLVVTWAPGGVVATTSGTNAFPGIAPYNNGGNILTWPTGGSFTQLSSSGSGTGLTVNMTEAALPLSTTILGTFTGGTSIPLNANCSQTLNSSAQFVTYGHDDQPQIQAAISTDFSIVRLPSSSKKGTTVTYGIRSPIVLNNSYPQIFDCGGATIVALNAMTDMFVTNTNGGVFHYPYRGKVRNCILEGMGLVTIPVVQGGDIYDWDDITVNDGITADVEVNKVGAGGSVVINNQFRFQIYNNPLMVPNYPKYCVYIPYSSATDNQFMPGEFWVGCQQAALYDQTFGTMYTGPIHAYTVTSGPIFQWTAAGPYAVNMYADNPVGQFCGFQLAGSYGRITDWTVLVSGSYNTMNQGGVCTSGGNNLIANGIWNAVTVPTTNGCQPPTSGSGQYSNIFVHNVGCDYVAGGIQNPQSPQAFTFNSGANLTAPGATNYCQVNGSTCSSSSINNVVTVPRGCQAQNFYFGTVNNTDIGSGQTYVATLLLAGANTLTCTLTGTGGSTTPPCSDATDVSQVNAGSAVEVKIVTSGSASAQRVYGAFECLALH